MNGKQGKDIYENKQRRNKIECEGYSRRDSWSVVARGTINSSYLVLLAYGAVKADPPQ